MFQLQIPRYSTLAERPVLGKIAVAASGTDTLVSGLDRHILAGILGTDVRPAESSVNGFRWESLSGGEGQPNGNTFVVIGNASDVLEKIRHTLGTMQNVDLATVFTDWT